MPSHATRGRATSRGTPPQAGGRPRPSAAPRRRAARWSLWYATPTASRRPGSRSVRVSPARPAGRGASVPTAQGGGPAGLNACETLRHEGFKGRIVLVTKEPHLPIDRVRLSKGLKVELDKLVLRDSAYMTAHGIDVLLATVRGAATRVRCARFANVALRGLGRWPSPSPRRLPRWTLPARPSILPMASRWCTPSC